MSKHINGVTYFLNMHFKCSLSLVSLKQAIPVENTLVVISCISVTRQHSYHFTQLAILVQDHAKKINIAKPQTELDRDTLKTGAMQQHDCKSVM